MNNTEDRSWGPSSLVKAGYYKLFGTDKIQAAGNRLRSAIGNLDTANVEQLRQDAKTLSDFQKNGYVYSALKSAYKDPRNKNYNSARALIDNSRAINAIADRNNPALEQARTVSKGLKPMRFLLNSAEDNRRTMEIADKLMSSNHVFNPYITKNQRRMYSMARPLMGVMTGTKQLFTPSYNGSNVIQQHQQG